MMASSFKVFLNFICLLFFLNCQFFLNAEAMLIKNVKYYSCNEKAIDEIFKKLKHITSFLLDFFFLLEAEKLFFVI